MPRPYARKKRKRSGWATQRATMQSIPRLTFKPMQVIRRSDLRLTCKINFGDYVGSAGWMSAQPKNVNWFFTINTNSIFPIFRAKNFNDPYDGTTFRVTNPTPPTDPPTPGYIGSVTLLDTVWEPGNGTYAAGSPKPLPPAGMTLAQMRDRDSSTGVPNPIYPTVAPGLFEQDGDVGFQYGEIGVLGCKVTAHWIPLVSDLDTQTAGDANDGTVDAMQTEESRLFAFMHTTGQGKIGPIPQEGADYGSPNHFVNHTSTWENDIALLPYVKARTITGATSQAKVGPQGVAAVTKLGNGAVLEYKTSPGAIHGTTVRDEKQLWSQNTASIASSANPTTAKFQHPLTKDFLTIGITKSLSNGPKRCPPSGKLELRIEQLIQCRMPMSTRTVNLAQQDVPMPAAGAAPGGNFFPGGPTSMGRLGGTLGTIAALDALFMG